VRLSRTGLFSNTRFRKSGLDRAGGLSRLGSSNDPWSGNFEVLQDCSVALPGITMALATPIKPLQQNPYGFVEEFL
jgi:hypothetical protein